MEVAANAIHPGGLKEKSPAAVSCVAAAKERSRLLKQQLETQVALCTSHFALRSYFVTGSFTSVTISF